jgi:hypothetical protein
MRTNAATAIAAMLRRGMIAAFT